MVAADALASLQDIVGEAHAQPASAEHAVDGMQPAFAVWPGSVEEVAAILKLARAQGLAVVARGAGSKLGWGSPPARADVLLLTTRLDRIVEHSAGDLVATAQAGVTLAAMQSRLAAAGQLLALDPPESGATLGGIIASAASGPRRLRYGGVRDLLIGITVVLADGTIAKSGGKVVKNVAGYDLGKLFTGSFGTLGVIVEATFRLHPLPEARSLLVLELDGSEKAGAAVHAVLISELVPSAVEVDWSHAGNGRVALLFEGVPPGVAAQAAAAASLLAAHGRARLVPAAMFDSEWAALTAPAFAHADLGLKLSMPPSAVANVLQAVTDVAKAHSVSARIAGRAGNGVLFAGLRVAGDEAQLGVVSELRRRLSSSEGSVIAVQADAVVKRGLDVWGYSGDALELMRRVKERFDPGGTLSPGRFVGAI